MTQSEKKDKASPRPWTINQEEFTITIEKQSEINIFYRIPICQIHIDDDTREIDKANAELIVRAVNHYEEMVEALKNIVEDYKKIRIALLKTHGHHKEGEARMDSILNPCEALLTKLNDPKP